MFTHDVDPRAVLNLLNTFAAVVVIIYNSSGVGHNGGCAVVPCTYINHNRRCEIFYNRLFNV